MAEEIGVLRVDLSLDSANFVKSTQQVDSKLRALNSEFKASKSGVENFEKSVEGLRAKQDFLTKTLELQKTKVSTLKAEYDKIAQSQGANSVAAEKMLVKYNNAVAALKKTETQLDKTNKAIKDQGNQWQKAESFADKYKGKLEATNKSLSAFGDKTTEVGRNLSVGLTTPLVAAGTALGMIAAQFENAQVNIQNSLGATSEEAGKLAEIAENVWADGFGENLETVSDALIRVKQNMKGINSEAELEKVTRDALILSKTFDSDVNEVTRAGQNVMKSFGVTSTEAFDTFAKAAQNGANFSNEMFDNISEYAPLAAKAGYSFAEYMNIVANASSAGVYNLDYVNDLLKETQIRLKNGSSTTSDAMKLLSKESNELWKSYLKGDKTVADVMPKIVSELAGMKDQTKANQIAVDLMGNKFEDMEADAVYSIFGVKKAIGDTTGAMDKMAKAQEQTFNQRWQSLLRQAQQRLEPVGKEILDIAEDWLPKLADGLERAVGWFSNLSEEGQGLIVKLAGIAAAAGPLMMGGGMFASGASNVLKLGSSLADAAKKGGLLAGALGAFTGPVGLGALAVGAIGAITVALVKAKDSSAETAEEMLKLQEETFNTQMKSYEAAKSNVELANSYDQLRDKSSLTVEELLRYKDIQSQLEATTSAEKVAILKDELSKLQEKSGLTSEEIARMLELDQQIIDTVPGVEAAYDSKGNAIIKYSESVKTATKSELELQKARLRNSFSESLSSLDENIKKFEKLNTEYDKLYNKSADLKNETSAIDLELQEIETRRQQAEAQGLEFAEQTIDLYARRKEIGAEIADLDDRMKNASGASLELLKERKDTLLLERDALNAANQEELTRSEYLKILLGLTQTEYETTQKKLETTNQEKLATEELIALKKYEYNQLLTALAAEVGITAEEGKQLEAMRAKYEENQKEISQLETKNKSAQGLTDKERQRLEELKKQNAAIGENIEEAETLNSTLSEDIRKEIGIDDNGEVDKMNKEASKTVSKTVQFKQAKAPYSYSSAIESLFTNPATKYVRFRALGGLPNPSANYQGTSSFEGGNTFVGELGVERAVLPSGKRIDLGVNGIELVNLPRGTRIYNHLETAKMDGLLPANANTTVFKDFNLENKLKNIRWFAEGGIMTGPTVFGQLGNTVLAGGEVPGTDELILPLNKKNLSVIADRIMEHADINIQSAKQPIILQVNLDKRVLVQELVPDITEYQNLRSGIRKQFSTE